MSDTILHLPIPLVLLVTSFIAGLLALAGWILRLERHKVDRDDFEALLKQIEARFTLAQQEIVIRLKEFQTDVKEARVSGLLQAKEDRLSLTQELTDLRASMRHVDHCPYLADTQRKAGS